MGVILNSFVQLADVWLAQQSDAQYQDMLANQQMQSLAYWTAMPASTGLSAYTSSASTLDPNPTYHLSRAERCAEQGDKLIGRIAFWQAFMPISARLLSGMADELNAITDEAERYIGMAQ